MGTVGEKYVYSQGENSQSPVDKKSDPQKPRLFRQSSNLDNPGEMTLEINPMRFKKINSGNSLEKFRGGCAKALEKTKKTLSQIKSRLSGPPVVAISLSLDANSPRSSIESQRENTGGLSEDELQDLCNTFAELSADEIINKLQYVPPTIGNKGMAKVMTSFSQEIIDEVFPKLAQSLRMTESQKTVFLRENNASTLFLITALKNAIPFKDRKMFADDVVKTILKQWDSSSNQKELLDQLQEKAKALVKLTNPSEKLYNELAKSDSKAASSALILRVALPTIIEFYPNYETDTCFKAFRIAVMKDQKTR